MRVYPAAIRDNCPNCGITSSPWIVDAGEAGVEAQYLCELCENEWTCAWGNDFWLQGLRLH